MSILEKHPRHIRKTIALAITSLIAIGLIIVLVRIYTSRKGDPGTDTSTSKIKDFYNTILDSGQRY